MNRIFRASDATVEAVRTALDQAWGYPNAETLTQTSILPAADCPHDSQGRCYVTVSAAYCEYEAVTEILPALLSSGQVEEITLEQFRSVFPLSPRPPRRR